MEYRSLGRTGLKVSELCLGTMTFGGQADEDASVRIIQRALDAGVNFIDTADIYPMGGTMETAGRTEEIVGKALRGRRDQVVLATKVRGATGPGPNDQGLSRRHIMQAVEASLRRLGTDYIDLYQPHWPDVETPLEETLRALDDLVRQGKVRYIGCSNFEAWRLCKGLWISDKLGLARFESLQPRYNLLDRRVEREHLPLCLEEGVGVIPYSPLGGGLLTGKYRAGEAPPAGTRGAMYPRFGRMLTEGNLRAVQAADDLARARGVTVAQFALGWLLSQPGVTAPIIGVTREEQLDELLGAAGLRLTPEELAAADRLWELSRGAA